MLNAPIPVVGEMGTFAPLINFAYSGNNASSSDSYIHAWVLFDSFSVLVTIIGFTKIHLAFSAAFSCTLEMHR